MFKKKYWRGLFISLLGISILCCGFLKYYGLNINEAALLVLTGLKNLTGESVELDFLENKQSKVINHEEWSTLLAKYVDKQGNVDYQAFQEEEQKLNQYLDLLSQNPPGADQSQNQQLTYWINAYNAFTVKLILNHYPLKGIKTISNGLPMMGSPWDIKFFKIGGVDFDLNTIEHEILRKKFKEPRIHFAINCASFSCPKLRTEAYTAEKLDKQLEEQSRDFLNDPTKNKINTEEAYLSKIFNWFESDFEAVGGVEKFVQKYHDQFQPDVDIEYLEYNWDLNEQKTN